MDSFGLLGGTTEVILRDLLGVFLRCLMRLFEGPIWVVMRLGCCEVLTLVFVRDLMRSF